MENYLNEKIQYIFWAFVVLLVSGSLFLFMQFMNEVKSSRFIGQGIEFRNTVSVSGLGEVTAVPDTSEFSFAVVKEAKTAKEAQKEVTEKMNVILDALKKDFNIDDKHIKTTNYSLNPRYEFRNDDGERIFVGFEVSHFIEVKYPSIDEAGEILARIASLGATNISGVQFTIEDEDSLKREARKKAIEDAKKRARSISKEAGIKLGRVTNVTEDQYGGGYYGGYDAMSAKAVSEPAVNPDIQAGSQTVKVTVTLYFETK